MANKQNEHININREAMVAFAAYLSSLANQLNTQLDSLNPLIKNMSDEDGMLGGSDLEQTRNMYFEFGVNVEGAKSKVKEASVISNKFAEVQEMVAGNKKRTTADYAAAAVKVAKQLKAGNAIENSK